MFFEKSSKTLTLVFLIRYAHSAPPGFPQSGNGLWYTQPGVSWYKDFLPIGNGYLGGTGVNLEPILYLKQSDFLVMSPSHDTWRHHLRDNTTEHRIAVVGWPLCRYREFASHLRSSDIFVFRPTLIIPHCYNLISFPILLIFIHSTFFLP